MLFKKTCYYHAIIHSVLYLSLLGGGSGGSIWIDCEELDGYGRVSANGGKGQGYGGGGSGGRVAIYHQTNRNFNGTIAAQGGIKFVSISHFYVKGRVTPISDRRSRFALNQILN